MSKQKKILAKLKEIKAKNKDAELNQIIDDAIELASEPLPPGQKPPPEDD